MSQIAPESIEELAKTDAVAEYDEENGIVEIRDFGNAVFFGRVERSDELRFGNVRGLDNEKLKVNIVTDDN